jgi:DNA-binding NtrC family response regulator
MIAAVSILPPGRLASHLSESQPPSGYANNDTKTVLARKEDIYLLAEYFLRNLNTKYGREPMEIPDPVIHKLMRYDWPGNVRELKNVIERAITMSKTKLLELPPDFMVSRHRDKNPQDFPTTLKENEARHILKTLEKTGWKVRGSNGAAEILGIPASTFFFKMKKHGIKRPNISR